MHQTTVRFSADLWHEVEREAADAGVSIAQYVREAALARVAYEAGRRGDPGFEAALAHAGAPGTIAAQRTAASTARHEAAVEMDSSAALWSQSELARRRSRDLRDRSAEIRRLSASR
jgi:hypothetical protein